MPLLILWCPFASLWRIYCASRQSHGQADEHPNGNSRAKPHAGQTPCDSFACTTRRISRAHSSSCCPRNSSLWQANGARRARSIFRGSRDTGRIAFPQSHQSWAQMLPWNGRVWLGWDCIWRRVVIFILLWWNLRIPQISWRHNIASADLHLVQLHSLLYDFWTIVLAQNFSIDEHLNFLFSDL